MNAAVLQRDGSSRRRGGIAVLQYISAASYALDALVTIEFDDRSAVCAEALGLGVAPILASYLPTIPALGSPLVASTLRDPGPSCSVRFGALLETLGVSLPYSQLVGVLVGYLAIVHLLTLLALRRLARHSERR